jgi:hypothetical protein
MARWSGGGWPARSRGPSGLPILLGGKVHRRLDVR